MKWSELEALAERNGWEIVLEDYTSKGGKAWAGLHLNREGAPPEYLEVVRPTVVGAKRALCRAVEKIRDAR